MVREVHQKGTSKKASPVQSRRAGPSSASVLASLLGRPRRNFKAFVDNAPAAVFIKDGCGRYTYLNRQWEQAVGKEQMRCMGRTNDDLWPQDIATRFAENDKEALASNKPVEVIETTLS